MIATLPVGLSRNGQILTQVDVAVPTGAMLRQTRDNFLSNKRRQLYLDLAKAVITKIDGLGTPTESDILSMYMVDVEFVYYTLALLDCAGKKPELSHTCPHCGNVFKREYDLEKVRVARLGDEGFDTPFDNPERAAPFVLSKPVTGIDADDLDRGYTRGKVGLMSFGDWLDITCPKKTEIRGIGTVQSESLVRGIIELGPDWRNTGRVAVLDKMPTCDIKTIEKVYNGERPGVKPDTEVECPRCERTFDVFGFDWVTDFFVSSAV